MPGADDRKASLAVRRGDDGRVVLDCHAGCNTDGIVSAMGLTVADLFEAPRERQPQNRGVIVQTDDYCDEQGTLVFQTVRYAPKDFRQRRPDGHGGWIPSVKGVRLVLYRLPLLKDRPGVAICAGEKDADALAALGIPATTNPLGEGKWREMYTEQLVVAGVKRVRIFPDNDDVGRAHADQVARSCLAAALEVKVIPLPAVPAKGDVSDYLATHSKDDLLELVQAAAVYTPSAAPASEGPRGVLQLTALGDLLAEPEERTEWVVADRIPRGSLCLLAGKPKAGKSTLARNVALQVARGGPCLSWRCAPGPVWYVVFEDKRSEVRRHFRQMGADGHEPVRFIFPQQLPDLLPQLQALATDEQPALIIVDTLQRLISARDLNDYAEVTTKLTPLLTLSRETGAAVLLVHHAGKGDRAGIDAVLGSTALAGSVDNILLYSRTEQYRLLSSDQRIGPNLPESIVLLEEDTGCVRLGATKRDADVLEMTASMRAALQGSEEALTEEELGKLVEGRAKVKREALRRLVQGGEVRRTGAGKRGDPFRYAVSPTLVPVYMREQEIEQPKTAKNPDKHWSDSRSQKTPELPLVRIGVKINGGPSDGAGPVPVPEAGGPSAPPVNGERETEVGEL